MAEATLKRMDLEIYDKRNTGNQFERFPFPVLTINKGYSYFNGECAPLIEGNSKWIIARDRESGDWYVAFLSEMVNIRGFSLKRNPKARSLVNGSYCKGFLKKYPDFKLGNYKICTDECRIVKDIGWFPLEYLKGIGE